MASKSKVGKNESEFGGRKIDLQRFAYDVFSYSALKFGVPNDFLCGWEGKRNDYGRCNLILALSRVFLKYQITERYSWYKMFKSRYDVNKFSSFEDIRQILQQVLQLSLMKGPDSAFHELIISLSVINEIIIFLYMNNCNVNLNDLTRFWLRCFAPKKQKFEKDGGFNELYRNFTKSKYDCVDAFYDKFIAAFCSPYDDSEVLSSLDDFFQVESNEYFLELTDNLPDNEKVHYQLAMHNTLWRGYLCEQRALESRQRKEVCKRLEADLPANSGLRIPQHEELLRESGISVGADTTSLKNLPSANCQEVAKERRKSNRKEKKQVTLEADLPISEDDLPSNSGLGIPQHEELLRESGVLAGADVPLSQNFPGARERRKLSVQDRRRKRHFDSRLKLEKDFEKLNLDSSE